MAVKSKLKKTAKTIPIGVKAISIIYWITSFLLILGGISLMFGGRDLIAAYPALAPVSGFLIIFAVIFIAIAILEIFVGIGLWKGRKWALITAIVLSILGIVFGLLGMFDGEIASNMLTLVINLIIAGYLLFNPKVKQVFY